MDGIILIDKPQGFTSFDVVAVMRGLFGQKKAGHTGTLDPLATGVLPVLLGKATRCAPFLEDTDKAYLAQFQLGIATDTQDSTGKVIAQSEQQVTREQIEKILPQFTGEILQLPPMYSAVQKNGQRLYTLARQGIEIEREKRPVTIFACALHDFDRKTQTGTLMVRCSKGTYIRTLCHDIGIALDAYATMTALRRTQACGFDIAQTLPLEQARQMAKEHTLQTRVLPIDAVFAQKPALQVSAAQAVRFCNGGALGLERLRFSAGQPRQDGAIYRVYGSSGEFLGLGVISVAKSALCILRLFCREDTV